ncbi:hypothetical protein R1sor_012486 [Riccia sorocarpa]|uniref:BTB domain-containing protein n=1 Tax=Riccia sorocarpa TaxID=122646 RepID=A0ABD3I7J5_9MARC
MASGCLIDSGMSSESDLQLRELVDNVELSDVTFVSEDGVRVHGCRGILAVRSPFFRRLLFGQMMESKDSNVELPTVSSQVLILVMKFLYTGRIVPEDLRSSTSKVLSGEVDHGTLKLDWNFLVKSLAATTFLMLDQLGRILLDQLLDDTPQEGHLGEDSLIQLAKSFSVLHEYPAIWTVDTEGNSIEVAMNFIYAASQNESSRSEFDCSIGALVLSWEINLIPKGSLEQQSIANFEVGFIALSCGETFPQDVISPISADSRSSVVRIGSDSEIANAFCEGREVHRWVLHPNDQFHWRKPFKVTVKKS